MNAESQKSVEPWGVILFYMGLVLFFYSSTSLQLSFTSGRGNLFLYAVPLLLGFGFVGASTFTAAFCRWWGERWGELATSILRNYLGIPLGAIGLIVAWLQPAPFLFDAGTITKSLGWLFITGGLVPFYWGHLILGRPTGWPSRQDRLVRDGLYAFVRHPIYCGGLSMFVGAALLKPTSAVVLACALGFVWLLIQARLEEFDLLQRRLHELRR